MPLDIATVSKMMNEGKSMREVAAALGSSKSSLVRFSAKHGLTGWQMRGSAPTPIPSDFADVATSLTLKSAQKRYGCSHSTARRWFDEVGIEPSRQRRLPAKAPDDIVERSQGVTIQQLAKELGMGRRTVSNILRKNGLPARKSKPLDKPITKGFAKPMGAPLARLIAINETCRSWAKQYLFCKPLAACGAVQKRANQILKVICGGEAAQC